MGIRNTKFGAAPELLPGAPPVIAATTSSQDEYDYENRLIKRSNGTATDDTTITIVYDGDGNRMKKTVAIVGGSTTTTYFFGLRFVEICLREARTALCAISNCATLPLGEGKAAGRFLI